MQKMFERVAACALTLIAFGAASARPVSAIQHSAAHSTVEDWMDHDAIALSTGARGQLDRAVDQVIAALGADVQLLGFGEALHGSEDILQLRNRVFQRLVEQHGYSAIAIESSFPDARLVDEYVAGGGSTYEAVAERGFGWSFGRLAANRELVEWMRRYNADLAHPTKLRFYGFDISAAGGARVAGPDGALNLALDYLAAIDAERAGQHRARIAPLLGQLSGWENPDVWIGKAKAPGLTPAATALRIATEDLINELLTRRPELVAKSDTDRYLTALRYARIARETLNFHAALARSSAEPPAGLRSVRDALMADNLVHIVERERGRGKVMVFAHNGHLVLGKSFWPCCGQKYRGTDVYEWWSAGSQLKEILGSRYRVIGTGVGVSDDANGIGPAEASSLEARLTALEGPVVFIPTYRSLGLPTAQIASLPLRSGSAKNLTYTVLEPHSMSDFDWLAILDSTERTREISADSARAAPPPSPVSSATTAPVSPTASVSQAVAARASAPVHGNIAEWVRKDAIPFRPDAADEVDASVDKLIGTLGSSVELLGFGEALHGAEDIVMLRNRVFKRLVSAHGYSAIVLETGFDEAVAVNEYIAGRGPSSYEALLDSGYGRAFGRLEANRDLVEWMRRYNADPAHRTKLSFYGFDISVGKTRVADPGRVLGLALEYLASVDGTRAGEHHRRIDPLLAEASGWAEAWTDPSRSPARKPVGEALRIATEDLIAELRTRRPELAARTGSERYLAGLQYALVARRMLAFHAALAITTGEPAHGTGLRGVRDLLMADNLQYILSRERDRGKVMVFAHNGHLQRGSIVWPCCGQKYGNERYTWWPAGAQLRERIGERYAVIGNAVGTSDEKNGLSTPEPGSLEGLLTASPAPALFIPTHQGRAAPAAEIAAAPPRSGSPKNLSYTTLEPQSFTDFDWLAVLDSTQYVRQLQGSRYP